MKLIMAEAGVGSIFLVELMSLPAGSLQGKQWRDVVTQQAAELGLPRPVDFFLGADYTRDSLTAYRRILDEAIRNEWHKTWCATAAKQTHPFPYACLVQEPKPLSTLLAENGVPWETVVASTEIVRFRTGLVPLGVTADGTPSKALDSVCPCCGQPVAGNLQHLVLCVRHASLMEQMPSLPLDGWSRACNLFNNEVTNIQERVQIVSALGRKFK